MFTVGVFCVPLHKNGTHTQALYIKAFREMCTMCTINIISLTQENFFKSYFKYKFK